MNESTSFLHRTLLSRNWGNVIKEINAHPEYMDNTYDLVCDAMSQKAHKDVLKLIVGHPRAFIHQLLDEVTLTFKILVTYNHWDVLQEMISNTNVDVNQKNVSGDSLLITLCRNSFKDADIRALFEQMIKHPNIDVNSLSKTGESALHLLVKHNDLQAIKDLLKVKEINLDIANNEGDSPLMTAILTGADFKICKLLIDSGANINLVNKKNSAPVTYAVGYDRYQTLKYLVEAGAYLPFGGGRNETLLQAKIKNSYGVASLKTIKYLSTVVDVNHRDIRGKTIAHSLFNIQSRQKHLINLILSIKNLNFNVKDNLGKTPLHYAAIKKSTTFVKKFIELNVDLKIKDEIGFTPAMYSVYYNAPIIAELLIPFSTKEEANDLFELSLKVENLDIKILKLITDLLV